MRSPRSWFIAGLGLGALACASADPHLGDDAPVAISEIMYHPVLENAPQDDHEFVELHNRARRSLSLAGWRLAGGISYLFSSTASLAPGQYLVVAKNKEKLLAVTAYGLDAANVLGNYEGELDNGGARLSLIDAEDRIVDTVKYDDDAPWPIAADALGAGEAWLGPDRLPLARHQYMGISLERIDLALPADEVANWAPSPIDGATPGRINANAGTPLPVVELSIAAPEGAVGLIRQQHRTVITVRFSKRQENTVKNVAVEAFVDSLVDSLVDADGAKAIHTAAAVNDVGVFQAVLPAQPDNSIVRYRILADRGNGQEVVSPRPSDPFGWHAYFVTPPTTSAARTHQLFIAPADWGRMWTNIAKGPNMGCTVIPSWGDRVPAVFVHEGTVYDVQVRYQGSRYQRTVGQTIAEWNHPGPSGGPAPLKALSWKISFPRHRPFQGSRGMVLHKIGDQGCPGLDSVVESQLLWKAGIPTARFRFARFHVNGGYYHYMMEVENITDDLMQNVEGAGKPIGDLFKSDGASAESGPWTKGDGAPIKPACGFTSLQRYQATYERQSHTWKGEQEHGELIKLIEDLAAAKVVGLPAIRDYFEQNFQTDKLLSQYAIRNWAGVWDDTYHNWFPYKPPGGKWYIVPQDFDLDFGGRLGRAKQPVTASFYIGEEGSPANIGGLNHLKSAFIKAFRTEFDGRLVELSKTILAPDNVLAAIDEAAKQISMPDFDEAPAIKACDVPARVERMKSWVRDRHALLQQGIR